MTITTNRPDRLTDKQLRSRLVSPEAGCADGTHKPDDWYPVSGSVRESRLEAAGAIAVCQRCPVRAECLEWSLRHWDDGGRHGVWGGLVEGDRRVLRHRRATGGR